MSAGKVFLASPVGWSEKPFSVSFAAMRSASAPYSTNAAPRCGLGRCGGADAEKPEWNVGRSGERRRRRGAEMVREEGTEVRSREARVEAEATIENEPSHFFRWAIPETTSLGLMGSDVRLTT